MELPLQLGPSLQVANCTYSLVVDISMVVYTSGSFSTMVMHGGRGKGVLNSCVYSLQSYVLSNEWVTGVI